MLRPAVRRLAALVPIALLVAVVPLSSAAAAAPAGTRQPDLVGRVLLQLDVASSPAGALSALAGRARDAQLSESRARVVRRVRVEGGRTVRTYGSLPFVSIEASGAIVRSLLRSTDVEAVLPDEQFRVALTTSSAVVGAPAAWAAGYDGTGQTVAVLDSGVQADHLFLGGRVVDEACFSRSLTCPNGQATQRGPGSAAPCTYDARACGHGTHVAGIVAGQGSTGSGTGRGASISAVQVFSRLDSVAECGGQPTCAVSWTSDILAGLDHVAALARTRPVAAVNLSLGGASFSGACDGRQPALTRAIDTLLRLGVVTVAASGNDGLVEAVASPACISTALAVGATASTPTSDDVTTWSNSSAMLDLLAPGFRIRSSYPGSTEATRSGTSMATPHVAGALAVLRQKSPTAPPDQLVAALLSTGKSVLDARQQRTTPRVQIDRALLALAGAAPVVGPAPAAGPAPGERPAPVVTPAPVPVVEPAPEPNAPVIPPNPVPAPSVATSVRLSGSDRYDTAARIFAAGFGCPTGGVASLVLARGDAFADALAGSYLAGSRATGVLLTAPGSVPAPTLSALRGSGARTVYLLGGSTAISDAVATQLARTPSVACSGAAGPPLTVVRIAGSNRFDTARFTALQPGRAAVGTADLGSGAPLRTAVLASGLGFADALAAGPLSYAGAATGRPGNGLGFPTLLTTPTGLSAEAEAAVLALGVQQVLVPGGTAVVGPGVESRLRQLGVRVVRVAGANRSETASLVGRFAVDRLGFDPSGVTLARGDAFADALAGAANAGDRGQQLLLTAGPDDLGAATRDALTASSASRVTAFGGLGAISAATLADATRALAS